MTGRTIAHYEVLGKLGVGGMGVVYRARDTRLDRQVAIKALPDAFATDPDRLARFEREAKVLASFNHPYIGAVYGLEEVDGNRFLILELVEGETLAERIGRGPIPFDEALQIARQIAEALEAAHDRRIVHRDLKPGNIKITPEGAVKVLDFGLAKTLAEPGALAPDAADAPTVSDQATEPGVVLGTAAYMSPEQVSCKSVDERTDVWAFGCVLFEALAGTRAFSGATAAETMAAILQQEPDWSLLPKATPTPIRILLQRCLRKDVKRRFRHISDARIEVDDALNEVPPAVMEMPHRKRWTPLLASSVVVLALGAAAVTVRMLSVPAPRQLLLTTRLDIKLQPNQRLFGGFASSVALSPDGRHVVYVGQSPALGLPPQLHLRSLDDFTVNSILGTEEARAPFFSPDAEWVAFFARGKLWKVRVSGGRPVSICDAPPLGTGGSWGPDGTIIFSVFGSGLLRVSANGGRPEELTAPKPENGELGHQWPQILPDEKSVLFAAVGSERSWIGVVSLETGEQRLLVEGSDTARYVSTGHLVYSEGEGLWAVAFDLASLELRGAPTQMVNDVTRHFTVSETGSLVYAVDPPAETRLVWVDREGQAAPIVNARGRYRNPRLSPDERRIAVNEYAQDGTSDIWIYDLVRGTRTRLTSDGRSHNAVWSPDGSRIAFSSAGSGSIDIYWKAADAGGAAELLLNRDPYPQGPLSWSSDGQTLLFWETHPDTRVDIWALSLAAERSPSPVAASAFNEPVAALSPDGGWLAYVSDESGRDEVYVQAFPRAAERRQISTAGGWNPVWSADGKELFYLEHGILMVAAVQAGAAGKPRPLFQGRFIGGFDVAPDGQRFVMTESAEDPERYLTELRVVLNWFQELESRIPAGKDR